MSSKVSILIGFIMFNMVRADIQGHFLSMSHKNCRSHNMFFYWNASSEKSNDCAAQLQTWMIFVLWVIGIMIVYILCQALTNFIEGIDRRKKYRYFE